MAAAAVAVSAMRPRRVGDEEEEEEARGTRRRQRRRDEFGRRRWSAAAAVAMDGWKQQSFSEALVFPGKPRVCFALFVAPLFSYPHRRH